MSVTVGSVAGSKSISAGKVSKSYVLSRGEYLNGKILAAYLDVDFVDAKDVIRFDENGGIEGDAPTLQDIVASASGAPKVAQKTKAAANRPAVVKKSAPRYKTIVVKRGQSLTRLAAEHGVTIAELKRANNLRGDQINVGQRLRVAQ